MMNVLKTSLVAVLASLTLAVTAGCAVTDSQHNTPSFSAKARWVLLPIVNYSQAPQAGERAEAIAATLIRKEGVGNIAHYPANDSGSGLPELNDANRYVKALAWAKSQDYQYGLSGAVSEWAYKTGLDGEPAVGLTVQVVDIATGQVVWSASGADSGWGYDTLSGTAQELLETLIGRLPLQN